MVVLDALVGGGDGVVVAQHGVVHGGVLEVVGHADLRHGDGLHAVVLHGAPQRFRDEMRLPWDPERQRRFDRLMTVLRVLNRVSPRFVREFPFNVLLKDLDWRMRTGRPLV